MDSSFYTYNGKLWKPNATVQDYNSFFHCAFGTRDKDGNYFDKQSTFRRTKWLSFLTYFQNETKPSSLTEKLSKCFSSKDKYKRASIEDEESIESYISDIILAGEPVTLDEVAILATTENIEITVVKDGDPNGVVVIKPDVTILQCYPVTSDRKDSVVLLLKGTTFSRLHVVEDPASPLEDVEAEGNPENQDSMPFINSGSYKRLGSAGSKGTEYQINLLVVVLLNALRKLETWRVSTENVSAGKFDDVVVEWPTGAVLIQAKHKESRNKRITWNEFVSTGSKNSDFSLAMYFFSYHDIIKKEFKRVKEIVICTNADIHDNALPFLVPQKLCPENLLSNEELDCCCQLYTLNNKRLSVSDLKEIITQYYDRHLKNQGLDASIIRDENIKDFQEHLHLYFKYLPLDSTNTIVENLLTRTKCSRISPLEICNKVKAWFHQTHGVYLNETSTKVRIAEIWRDKYFHMLDQHRMTFERNSLSYETSKRIVYVSADGAYLLQAIKVYQALQDFQRDILCFDTDNGEESLQYVVDGFEVSHYKALMIIWRCDMEQQTVKTAFDKLRNTLESYTHKKVFLVTSSNNKLLQLIRPEGDYQVVEQSVTLEDFTEDSRNRVLEKECIEFQGRKVCLKRLLIQQVSQVQSEVLDRLVRGETIRVGFEVQPLKESVSQCYIHRTLKRIIPNVGTKTRKTENVAEENIYEENEKVVLIADDAGAGKSTILIHLAGTIKEKYPHLWVIIIELNAYTDSFKVAKEANRESIEITELMKFTNDLERIAFSSKRKVAVLIDGVDEISPHYTGLIVNMLSRCQAAQNIAKLFVTTRPFMTQLLQKELQVVPYILEPFNEQNQINFLTNYWSHHLQICDTNKARCEQYARMLLMQMSSWIRLKAYKESNFSAIPLHVTMVAAVFQENTKLDELSDWEGCKEYLSSIDVIPKFPEQMNTAKIYQMFIQRKRSIFRNKGSPSGNTTANLTLDNKFDECLVYHETLALEVILEGSDCKLFSHYRQVEKDMEEIILKMGILQKSDNKFYFPHRTFAEYFVANSVLCELRLQTQNENKAFQKFFFDQILLNSKFEVVRTFLDSLLLEFVDVLPSDIFQSYERLLYDIDLSTNSNLIHQLAGEGCVVILQLLFKCINWEIVNNYERDIIHLIWNFPRCSNTLKVLQFIVQQSGVNIKNEFGYTPLQLAVQQGHFEMIKLLIDRGANVNITFFNKTPLQTAIDSRYFDIVKLLVEKGADINVKTEKGCSILYKAVSANHVGIVEYLLKNVLMNEKLNSRNPIIPYTFAYLGRLEDLKHLLKTGVAINSVVVENDETLIFGAARGGQLDTIKYLIDQGADINSQDEDGNTMLHLVAMMSSRLSTAELLVKLGIDVNVKNFSGNTALFCGIRNLDMVKLLVKSGASMDNNNDNGGAALHHIASIGRLDVVQFLIEQGCDVNVTNKGGETVLHSAATSGNLDVIKFLLDKGLDLHGRGDFNNTLIHSALHSLRGLDVIRYLVKSGLDTNIKNSDGNAPLHTAVMMNSQENVEYFLEVGADVNITNNGSQTALHIATSGNQLGIVRLLIEGGVDDTIKDKHGCTALQLAALKGYSDIYNYLLKRGAIFITKDNDRKKMSFGTPTLLHLAAQSDRIDEIIFFYEMGVDMNITTEYFGDTPLHFASQSGQLDTVRYIVQHGADITIKNRKGYTPLHVAACRFLIQQTDYTISLNIIKYLIECGADVNTRSSDGCTLLHSAFSMGNFELIKLLIKSGVNIHHTDNNGNTVLHYATNRIYPHIISLIALGLDVNIKNKDGHTALHLAAIRGWLDVAELLKNCGSDIKTTDNQGRWILHSAAMQGRVDALKYLIESDINVNIRDDNGSTPLHLAASVGHLQSVQYLVGNFGDVNIQDEDGRTALHLAALKGNIDIVKCLVTHHKGINVRDKRGYTVLHLIASENSVQRLEKFEDRRDWRKIYRNIVKFLIKQGADVNIRDSNGDTALNLAEKKDHFHLYQCLRSENR